MEQEDKCIVVTGRGGGVFHSTDITDERFGEPVWVKKNAFTRGVHRVGVALLFPKGIPVAAEDLEDSLRKVLVRQSKYCRGLAGYF